MKRNKLLFLSGMTIVVVVAATFFAQSRAPQTKLEKEKLFPELINRINDITSIEIKDAESRTVKLNKQENIWTVSSADNYPALFEKIKDTVISVAELQIISRKTDNPKLYADLGVDGIETESSQSKLLTFKDQTGNTLAEIIIGKPKKGGTSNIRPSLYVRQADGSHALLVEGYLSISAKNTDWYESNIIHLPASRFQFIDILKNNGDRLVLGKATEGETDFKVAKGKTSAPKVLQNKLATFFEDMRAEGVYSVRNVDFPDEFTSTTFSTFNGLLINVKSFQRDGKTFAHFSFSTVDTPPEPETEKMSAEEESQLWGGFLSQWVYVIPEFKSETLHLDVSPAE